MSDLTFHRQAEVVVPGELPLSPALRRIGVRSQAEYETMRTKLHDAVPERAAAILQRVQVDHGQAWFFKEWTFIDHVNPSTDDLIVVFNRRNGNPRFDMRWAFHDGEGATVQEETCRQLDASGSYRIPIPFRCVHQAFRFSIRLDGHLAYENVFGVDRQSVIVPTVK